MSALKSLAKSPIKSKQGVGEDRFSLLNLTKGRIPVLPFLAMKNTVLGRSYALSLVIVGDRRSQTLNKKYRNKSYTPNVLSFPVNDGVGEIFLNLKQARREHRSRGETYEYFVALLFIHSMLHLMGMRHGSTMEETEQNVLKKFNITNK